MLQADSEEQCQAWIQAIQAGVSKAYNTRQASMDSSVLLPLIISCILAHGFCRIGSEEACCSFVTRKSEIRT